MHSPTPGPEKCGVVSWSGVANPCGGFGYMHVPKSPTRICDTPPPISNGINKKLKTLKRWWWVVDILPLLALRLCGVVVGGGYSS